MAEAPDAIEQGLERLEKQITCPICDKYFCEPKILPCCHYFCKECIRQATVQSVPFSCPDCHKDTYLPQNDPDKLPTVFFVNRMRELHAKLGKAVGRVAAICEMCSSGEGAMAFCHQCTLFICDECVRSHQKMKVFVGHQVVTVEELKEGGAKQIPLAEVSPMMCKDHDEQMKIFCFDCNHLICRDCIVIDHAGHDFEFTKKAAPKCKANLSKSLDPLKKLQHDLSDSTQQVEFAQCKILDQGASVNNAIQLHFNKLFLILRRREQELLAKASKLVQQKIDSLSVQVENLNVTKAEIQSLVEFVEHKLQNIASDEEVMTLHKQVLARIEEERLKHEDMDLNPAELDNISLRVSCTEALIEHCQRNTDVYLSQCQVEGSGIEATEVGNPSTVIVHTTYLNGKPCREVQHIEAKLKSMVDGSVVAGKATRQAAGTYEIVYTPKVRGRHHLTVAVNSCPVPGSPFTVLANIPHPAELGKTVMVIENIRYPWGVAFNSQQEVFVTEYTGGVKAFNRHGKQLQNLRTVMKHPTGISADKDDNLYVADGGNHCLFKFNREGKVVKVAGRHGSHPGELSEPGGVTVIGEKVFVCDRGNHRVLVFNRELEFHWSFGSWGDGDGLFKRPQNIVQDNGGNLYVTDLESDHIQVFDSKGWFLRAFQHMLKGQCGLFQCNGLLYITDCILHQVCVFRTNGDFIGSFGSPETLGKLNSPRGIAIDRDGFVYVCDHRNSRIQVF